MTKKTNRINCTNTEWVGRSHCDKCHIRHFMLFSELPESAFERTLQPIDHFLHPPGSIIYESNTQKQFIYSIRRGLVKLVRAAEDGTNRIVRLLGAGSSIGLELLNGANSYHHTAIAVNQVDLCKIPVSVTAQLEGKYPALIRHIGQQLQQQLNLADQWIVALGTGSARQRVAQLILILNECFTEKNHGLALLNGEDMAAITGITIETVSRIIAEFKRQNILYKNRDNLYMCDVAALQKITRID